MEELSVYCHCDEDGTPVKGILENLSLKKADAEGIYVALVKCVKDKNLQVGNIVGMGLMVLPLFLIKRLVFKKDSRNMLHMQYLSTVTLIFN